MSVIVSELMNGSECTSGRLAGRRWLKQRRLSMAALADRRRALTLIAVPSPVTVLAPARVPVLGSRIHHALASTAALVVLAGIHLKHMKINIRILIANNPGLSLLPLLFLHVSGSAVSPA